MIQFFFTLLLICLSRSMITCPRSSWTEYKRIKEGHSSFTIPNSDVIATIGFERNTEYRCLNDENVRLRTTRELFDSVNRNSGYYSFLKTDYETCDEECDSRNVSVNVLYRNCRLFNLQICWFWSVWKLLGQFVYENKNCNKFYWATWIEISNCRTFDYAIYARSCEDCDGQSVNSTYCIGDQEKQNDCGHVWSDWVTTEPCKATGCNLNGILVRKRQCLYGESKETADVHLCSSNFNDSGVMTQQCDVGEISKNCKPHWNEWSEAGPCIASGCNLTGEQVRRRNCLYVNDTKAPNDLLCSNTSSAIKLETCRNTNLTLNCMQTLSSITNFTSLHVGIGVAVAFIFALLILLAFVKYRRLKSVQSRLNDIPNQANENFSPYEMATESPSTRQCNNPIENIEYAESNLYSQELETIAYNNIEPEEQEVYEQVMSTASQSIMPPECKNKQPIENNIPLYSIVQEPEPETETAQTNVYSSLDKPNDLQDNDYSSLDLR